VNRRAVVTGASSGIGAATVRELRSRGWDVVGVARREDRLTALVAETGASAIACDLTDSAAVDALIAELEASGPVHALVQVAGGARGTDRIEDGSVEDWQWMFDANVLSTQRLVKGLLPLLRRAAAADGHADTVFVGPGEDTWPEFLADFRRRAPRPRYVSTERTLAGLPPVRRDLIRRHRYLVPNSIVVSRGCPHHCDFCYKDAFFAGGKSFYTQAVDDALE